jgi:phosphoglycerate dehydrogenase-like enzyme/pimeloyl-ACP methyl ester carboxylesterase
VLDGIAAAGLRPVAVDFPGFGRSGGELTVSEASVPRLSAWLVSFLDALGQKGPVMVAGHDIGGGVAQHLMLSSTTEVPRVAVVNGIMYDSWPVPGVARFRDPAVAAATTRDDVLAARRVSVVKALGRPASEAEIAEYLDPWTDPRGARSWLALAGAADNRYTQEMLPALLKSRTPKLLVWGEDDPFQTVDYAERYAREVPEKDQVGRTHSDGKRSQKGGRSSGRVLCRQAVKEGPMKVAILDDYQNVALQLADWSAVRRHAEITVFNDHVADPSAVVERLRPFEVVCVMRERTPLTREILQQLPNLKLIASTGPRNASIDTQTAADLGITVTATGYDSTPTIEFTWSLILASMRGIDREAASLKAGGWQTGLGSNLQGKSLGVVGLGNIGREVARIGIAFGMKVIAWSQNLTEEKASAAGATLVDKQTLFREADVVTVHLVLSGRTRGLIGAPEFALMKPTARFVNTSRGPIVDEVALIEALQARRVAGAAVDVFDAEPLPADHPFRKLDNVLATPHIGYVTEDLYRIFYGDAAANTAKWIEVNATSA